jgi:hypothetical protein
MAGKRSATHRGERHGRAGDQFVCVAATAGMDCAVAELTDALLACDNEDGAVIIAATAACAPGACWVLARLSGVQPDVGDWSTDAAKGDESAPLAVNA